MTFEFQFTIQEYQTEAVRAVVDCLNGQPRVEGVAYRIDPGMKKIVPGVTTLDFEQMESDSLAGTRNAEAVLDDPQLLKNIQSVQHRQNICLSSQLERSKFCIVREKEWRKKKEEEENAAKKAGRKSRKIPYPDCRHCAKCKKCRINLDIEMETGTGKTYCYLKTILELHRRYGWSKFVIIVPSIPIQEGVVKSIEYTSQHFLEEYKQQLHAFVYDSSRPEEIQSFSSKAGIQVMVTNIYSFNSSKKEARLIHKKQDRFQSRRPMDVLAANRPILILDEPQKMSADNTRQAITLFNPLMMLHYSATHKVDHNKIYRLDAVDAYNRRLVKKIAVHGITIRGLGGLKAYLYLKSIEVTPTKGPQARMELEVRMSGGKIKRKTLLLSSGDDLYAKTKELEAYKGLKITNIDAAVGKVEIGKHELSVGEVNGNVDAMILRRIQIRETIKAHLEKERELFSKGIKVLSLFFIDHVKFYRDYALDDTKGDYARIFEEEYESLKNEFLRERLRFEEYEDYRKYLESISVSETHEGYFSIDKSQRFVDPEVEKKGENKGESGDKNAYDLILKDKKKLLSLKEERQVRFLFSHSALGVGWDNPNVFVMCMLKQTDNEIRRRQEVGRGLRLAVNQEGCRMDRPKEAVHETNRLTVVANESYKDFVEGLQKEIRDSLSSRPKLANQAYFQGKAIHDAKGNEKTITDMMASRIVVYLNEHGYIDDDHHILDKYYRDKDNDALAELPSKLLIYGESIFKLVDDIFSDSQIPIPDDAAKTKFNNRIEENFRKKEFQELWNRINRKVVYRVDFDSTELTDKSVEAIDKELAVPSLQSTVQRGEQHAMMSAETLIQGKHFEVTGSSDESEEIAFPSEIPYDLIGKISSETDLKRSTVANILSRIKPVKFDMFRRNPEHFLSEVSRLINEQKACMIVEKLTYHKTSEEPESDIFAVSRPLTEKSRIGKILQKHVYQYAETDSDVEQKFSEDLDASDAVVVYAKLPRGFLIPTPLGNYNPDWAIVFKEGKVRHIYFVAETKGSISSLDIRPVEKQKIDSARRFFTLINEKFKPGEVLYDVVDSYAKLMDIAKGSKGHD